ncbi:hypothetical protein B0T20DRAFT_479878 [Sordaria brevicollis]|uniref:Uncharacterized protein n=1 Tax=Sordaria brevicollis TaxID=83679 RepID=A0AAE0PCZ6_SORBR|nr:hypothetical protein B0T20DRAFT_479878 [Sordaria brevicollis]
MGGSLFSSGDDPLHTPRMPPHVYHQVKAACHAVLRSMFLCVATPIEGPEKENYGDLDILVTMETGLVFPTSPQQVVPRELEELAADIKTASNAERVMVNPHTSSVHLAIPWPKLDFPVGEKREDTPLRFVQVDVHICRDLDQMFWGLFKSAHGDAWTLLGSIIRPFGLTADDEGLWLRIPEIEKLDRKKARVLLTTDPVEVLHFLGMQVEGYWSEPFATIDDMFTYISTCRFFVQESSSECLQGSSNSTNKRNMKTRPIFRKWFEDFLPRLRVDDHSELQRQGVVSPSDLRVRVRDEAFQTFCVESTYRTQLKDWRLKKEPEMVKNLIRSAIPDNLDPQFRGSLLSAIKKIVMEDSTEFGGPRPKTPLRDEEGFYDKEMTRAFVEEHWEEIGKIAFKKYSEAYYAGLQAKKLKDAQGTAIHSQ